MANAEYFGETVKRSKPKPKGKGVARATIASKREAIPNLKLDCDDDDIVMGDMANNGASKRKRPLTKSEQVY